MYVEVSGTGSDLVLLHGWSMNRHVWRPVLPLLEAHFTCHCVDLPGHGQSDWQPDELAMSGVLEQLCAQLPQHASWLGWSLGGQIALAMATAHPERVKQLILIASTPKFVAAEDWQHGLNEHIFAQFSAALQQDQQQVLQRFLALQAHGAGQRGKTLETLSQAMSAQLPTLAALQQGLRLLETLDQRADLSCLTLPVKVLLGEKDTLIPNSLATTLPTLLPAIKVKVIANAGHAPFISQPVETAQFILEQHDA